jgi:tRNA threonylcarbamoyladenosine biosynthesis protein TsaB
MPRVLLAIETATEVCSVALLADGVPVGVAEVLRPRSHAEWLVPLIRDLLAQQGLEAADVACVAVSAGPGSYTGLRIGVSTAKGLCVATGASLVAVPSLAALASGVAGIPAGDDLLVAAFRSRRGEVYAEAFRPTGAGLASVAGPEAIAVDAASGWLPEVAGTLWLIGEAAGDLDAVLPPGARVLDSVVHRPSALLVGQTAWPRWRSGHVEDVGAFEPSYLKPFEVRRATSIFEKLAG